MSRRRPPSPPEFFIDRSLGRYEVPHALRAAGWSVHTLADVYGESDGQRVDDITWLTDVGRRGWAVLLKDDRIRRRPNEIEALASAGVRAFCLTNANLRGSEQALRFVSNMHRIEQRCRKPGPFIDGVYADGLRRLWPPR